MFSIWKIVSISSFIQNFCDNTVTIFFFGGGVRYLSTSLSVPASPAILPSPGFTIKVYVLCRIFVLPVARPYNNVS